MNALEWTAQAADKLHNDWQNIGAAFGGGITGLLGVKTYSFLPVLNVFELGLFSGPDSKMIYEVFAIIVAFTVPVVLTIIYGKTRKLVASPAS
jgi:PTS system beta-glucosides-specific IIC component